MEDEKLLELANTAIAILKVRNIFKVDREYFIEKGCRDYIVDSWLPYICKVVKSKNDIDKIISETKNLEVGFLNKEKTLNEIIYSNKDK